MSARKRMSKNRGSLPGSAPRMTDNRNHGDGTPLCEELIEAIEDERRHLSKADSLLGCLIIAMEYQTEFTERPYYPDVAEIARELVKKSINALDPVLLQERMLRDKVKDYRPCFLEGELRPPAALTAPRVELLYWEGDANPR
jgi:hypothetical protein